MKIKNKKRGFTLIELLISIFIISLLTVTIGTFQKDVFSLNKTLQGDLNAQMDSEHVVKIMITELRTTSPSSLGAYPIALASPTAITFYSDLNGDGLKEKIRYYLSGNSVKRGIIIPTGNPLIYNDATEKTSILISNFVASSTLPLFQYYTSSYNGTGNPLGSPVNISLIRLVKVTAIIDSDPNRSPGPLVITSEVSLRNLKDNL